MFKRCVPNQDITKFTQLNNAVENL